MGRPLVDRLLYFSHDANASEHPKLLALRAHYGGDRGRAMEQRFWQLNGMIAGSSKCRLNITAGFSKPQIAQKLELTLAEFDDFITFLSDSDKCDLVHCRDGLIWTDRVDEDLQHYQDTNEKERERKQRERDRKKKEHTDGVVRPDVPDASGDNHSNPPGQQELSGRTTGIVTRMSGGKTPFSGETGRQAGIYKEQQQISLSNDSAAGQAPPAAPPADAATPEPVFSQVILRKELTAAGINLDKSQLQQVFQDLPASPFEARACVAYMLRRMKDNTKKIEKPVPYFLKVRTLWLAEWSKDKPALEKNTEQSTESSQPFEDQRAERERQEADPELMKKVALGLARHHKAVFVPLTDADRVALEEVGELPEEKTVAPVQRTFDEQTGEKLEKQAAPLFEEEDTFEDDLPYPAEKPAEEEEEMLF